MPAQHALRGPPETCGFSGGKERAQRRHPASPLPGRPTLGLRGEYVGVNLQGNLWGLTPGDKIGMEKGVGLIAASAGFLADCIAPCNDTQVGILASGSADLQNQASGPVWPGSSVGREK